MSIPRTIPHARASLRVARAKRSDVVIVSADILEALLESHTLLGTVLTNYVALRDAQQPTAGPQEAHDAV